MSFRQSCACGIDYREFERVDSLPIGIPLVAIAGVWGDCYNLRCLFMDTDGNQYLRNVFRTKNGYLILMPTAALGDVEDSLHVVKIPKIMPAHTKVRRRPLLERKKLLGSSFIT